jgi:hypothetical protein
LLILGVEPTFVNVSGKSALGRFDRPP